MEFNTEDNKNAQDKSPGLFEKFKRELKIRNYSPKTINRILSSDGV